MAADTFYSKFIEALTIFQKYDHWQNLSAEHDEVYAGPSPEVVSAEDLARLEELGWHEHDGSCFMRFV